MIDLSDCVTCVVQNLTNMLILDLYGNPVVRATDNYRLFVIYHLKPLKALDGIPIVRTILHTLYNLLWAIVIFIFFKFT